MAARRSAALLVYRTEPTLEILVVHPGGPFFARKDDGAWSLPKGEIESDDDPLATARREFAEELGLPAPDGNIVELGEIRQAGGKIVVAFGVNADIDVSATSSNTFDIEWPPRSGKRKSFPEVDRAAYFDAETATRKLNAAQAEFVVRLRQRLGAASDDAWAELADQFVDEAYASVKGRVRTYVLHQHLLEHLPSPPAPVLDVGGGAGHQSFPLAQAGYDVTLLDPSRAMLDKAQERLNRLPATAQRRVTLLKADGENADAAVKGRRFAAVLCHGVLGYLERPEPLVSQLCRCAAEGGIVSIMTGNAHAMAVRPALEQRWDDALSAFDATTEIGVLGAPSRADTVEELSELLRGHGVEPLRWYGGWLFVDWLEFGGAKLGLTLDLSDSRRIAAVELEASRRDPYRQLSRVFHLVGRKNPR